MDKAGCTYVNFDVYSRFKKSNNNELKLADFEKQTTYLFYRSNSVIKNCIFWTLSISIKIISSEVENTSRERESLVYIYFGCENVHGILTKMRMLKHSCSIRYSIYKCNS